MTAIDFAAFVDELAAVSGEALRPFFRTTLGVENKSISGGFDPGSRLALGEAVFAGDRRIRVHRVRFSDGRCATVRIGRRLR